MGAELEHNVTNEHVRCSLRQIKPLHVRLGADQDVQQEQSGDFAEGQLVVVSLTGSTRQRRKLSIELPGSFNGTTRMM